MKLLSTRTQNSIYSEVRVLFTASYVQYVLCFSSVRLLVSGLRAVVYHSLSLAKILLFAN